MAVDIKAAIEARKVEWKKFFDANDLISVSKIYTEDCKLMPQGEATVYGREEIPKGLTRLRNKGSTRLEQVTTEIGPMTGNCDFIFECGNYKFLKADGSTVSDGKHVVIWRKTTTGYEMYIDIFNDN